jgi:hypothetical protein
MLALCKIKIHFEVMKGLLIFNRLFTRAVIDLVEGNKANSQRVRVGVKDRIG